jgi:hypothetical protein
LANPDRSKCRTIRSALIVAAFGAIVTLAYRNRCSGFSYFARETSTPKVKYEHVEDF